MAKPSKHSLAQAVLDCYGGTYAEEIGIRLKNTPSSLYRLLNASLLMSARIPAGNAVEAAKALDKAKLTTPRRMTDATWQNRVNVITWHGYKRYDERTSTMLGAAARTLLERYGGDLRKLRDEAERDAAAERRLLQQFKGIGEVGADIFLREVQNVWDEVYPYADERFMRAAKNLGIGGDAKTLAGFVDRKDFPRFAAGLIRTDLTKGAAQQVKRQAAAS